MIKNGIEKDYLLYNKDSRDMNEIEDESIHLIVTSPPYNVQKEYEPEELPLEEYLSFLKDVFLECYRVLIDSGRICINISNVKRKPYIPHSLNIMKLLLDIGFIMRGEIIWYKESGCNLSTAWGSWKSANNPVLRDQHEYILVFSKGDYSRNELDRESTITRDEFLENTKSVWRMSGISNKEHPAVFPLELPYRLIQLYSFKDDIILDPFCGSGTTLEAALKLHRKGIGYDLKKEYIELSKRRISQINALEIWL